jgi:hypothetical protein
MTRQMTLSHLLFKSKHAAFAALLLFATEAFCQYTIPSFSIGDRPIPPSGNDIIIPFEGTTLKQLSTVPALEFGQVLLRRKFGASEYGLYIGKMNEKAYSQLSAFRPPQSMNINNILNLKFYQQETRNNDLDIQNLYFDNDFIYAQNSAKLFYNDGSWRSIALESKLPARLTVTSDPPGAQVFIDDNLKGQTPFYSGAIFFPSLRIKVTLNGYYTTDRLVTLSEGENVIQAFSLKPRLGIDQDKTTEEFSFESAQSVSDVINIITGLKKAFIETKDKNAKMLAEFNSRYPQLQPKSSFEKQSEYQARRQEYQTKKADEYSALSADAEQHVANLEQAISNAEKQRVILESREYTKVLSASCIKVSEKNYDAERELWYVKFNVNEPPFVFAFSGAITMPPTDASRFMKVTDKGMMKLTYQDRGVTVQDVRYYFCFERLTLIFDGKEYEMNGSYRMNAVVMGTSEFQNEILRLKNYEDGIDQNITDSIAMLNRSLDDLTERKNALRSELNDFHPPVLLETDLRHINPKKDSIEKYNTNRISDLGLLVGMAGGIGVGMALEKKYGFGWQAVTGSLGTVFVCFKICDIIGAIENRPVKKRIAERNRIENSRRESQWQEDLRRKTEINEAIGEIDKQISEIQDQIEQMEMNRPMRVNKNRGLRLER